MVTGLSTFLEKFKNYSDCYTIIGGAACEILMSNNNMDFRATKDIDMIILLEDRYQEFSKVFWEFIKEGEYKCGWKNSDKEHFYRFTDPKLGYPIMIELFSKKPNYHLESENEIIPIYINDDVSSLSAIMLNDDYYNFMLAGRKIINEICILSEEYLIPFKMYAFIDLYQKKQEGLFVKGTDLKKHKYDVFRLLQIVKNDCHVETKGLVKESINRFLELIINEDVPTKQLGLPYTKEEGIELLYKIYKNKIQL